MLESRKFIARIEEISYLSQSINRTRWEEKLWNTTRKLCEECTQVNPGRRESRNQEEN